MPVEKDYKHMSVDDVLKALGTSIKGLSSEEAKKRLEKYGPNEIPEKKVNPIIKFLSYFWGPIPWMIEIAAVLSAVVKHWADFWIIVTLLALNGLVGFWEEHKAENVIEFLKQKMALKARVLRDGKWSVIPARELVPGDVIRLRMGDIIPADVKLIEGDYLTVDESALTGESLPVTKKVGDIAFSGSLVKKGEMTAVVIGTGLNTYFGKTVQLVESAETVSSFQKMVIKVGDYLIVISLILVSIVFLVAIHRHESLLEALRFSLVLTVAAIPAAMPAVLSITMAIGALNLAKKQAIVTKLVSIEELAGVDVLCSDKTGTLTKNELTVGDPVPFNGYTKRDVVLYAVLASREEDNDPIDLAILRAVERFNLGELLKRFRQVHFTPFDPVIKRTEAEITNDENFKVAKGAPQVILDLCDVPEEVRRKATETVDELAQDGYRALGVARTRNGRWEFVGIIPLFDPPRDDAPKAIKQIRRLGVNVKMVTGDHIAIARHIAKILGLGTRIVSMSELLKAKRDSEVEKLVEGADGFSEVFPEHKFHIVDALQRRGHLVAMTGDGVNDAPALKKANCGIAVSGATDAARAAADVVLLQPGLSVIAHAIQEARRIFQRMESYVIYRITETIRVLFFITFAILVFNFYPITAVMIVLLALFNDAPILAIAYDNVVTPQKPVKWNMYKVLILSTLLGFVGVVSSFILFYIADRVLLLSRPEIQSFIFLKLAVAGHLTIFVTRARGHLWEKPYPSSLLLWSAIITKILATLVVVYGIFVTPIGWKLAGLIWAYALVWMLVIDEAKVIVLKRMEGL
ncbi:plasma-membrane proton-efflux P-type ATPase [Thermococcus sp. 5-4]|uniref:plasma-membrane proton-efflux P-type ATPase n=1 Tax=Thermococcus sp. 5-4 TaxID=2008440 RepID=UPI001D05925D|nr:plasma-membrane proton-efflux P-type ATPase [Thermococcus sp. 5-4]